MLDTPGSIAVAGICAFGAVCIAIAQILCHLRNYTEPVFQRYIIRLIFMVPVYALGSWFSLKYRASAIYFDTLRDCYESWIIYNFTALLLAYVGGPGSVVVQAEGKVVHPSWTHLTCCLPPMQVDGFFLRRCKQGTLQFVVLKPIMAALTIILYSADAYTDGEMSPKDGYFYISILYNVCYTFALYGLMLFWIGASELLAPFNPLLKFILVKTVVFLTFWQGIVISAINSMGDIHNPEDGKALQNFMICVEMLIAGCAMTYAFPHAQYSIGGSAAGFRLDAFAHAISMSDVIKDIIHVFAPSYSDYVLYTDGGPTDQVKRKKFRGQKGGALEAPKRNLIRAAACTGLEAVDDVIDAAGGLAGRRAGRPSQRRAKGEARAMERNRNMATLVNSDSDGMDSDEESAHKGHIGTEVTPAPSASPSGSDGEDYGSSDGEGGTPQPAAARAAARREPASGAPSPAHSRRATSAAAPAAPGGGGRGGAARTGSARRAATPRRRMRLLSSSDEEGQDGRSDGGEGAESDAEAEAVLGGGSSAHQRASRPASRRQTGAADGAGAAAGAQQQRSRRQEGAAAAAAPSGAPSPSGTRAQAQLPPVPAKPAKGAQQQAAGGSGGAPDPARVISLPPPKSSSERLAAARAAAAAAASEGDGGDEGFAAPAWAAGGWQPEWQASKKGKGGGKRGGGAEGGMAGWTEAGWSNI